MTLVEEIIERARAYPDRLAIAGADGTRVRYGELTPAHLLGDDGLGGYTLRSSGTSGPEKVVPCSEEQMRARVARLRRAKGAGFADAASVFTPMHLRSGGRGVAVRLALLLRGATIAAPGDARKTYPDDWLALCEELRIEAMMISTRMAYFDLFMRAGSAYKFAHLLVGAAPMSTATMRELAARRGGDLYYSYGCTEVGPAAGGALEEVGGIEGCVGRVLDDISLDIVDGVIWVSAPALVDGRRCLGDRGHFEGELLVIDGRA